MGNARNIAFWVVLFLLILALFNLFNGGQSAADSRMISYSDFISRVESGDVSQVTLDGENIIIQSGNERFATIKPEGVDVTPVLLENKVAVEAKRQEQNGILAYVGTLLPFLVIIGIWIFFMNRMQGGGKGGAMGFGKSKAKLLTEKQGRVTFDDVAGIDEAKDDLEEIVEFLRNPQKFSRLGGKIPKGALLVGPPGTGKTLLARAVAGEAGVPFFTISGSDFVEMFVGVGASRVRDMFEQAKKNAPCIVFIDEIDAVGRSRGAGYGGGNDEREQTLNQLLVEMDGFEANEGIIIVAATNRPDVLDPALLRPGRFDRQVQVPNPDIKGREKILRVHARKVPLGPDVDLRIIARGSPGFSGADLANLVNESALMAARIGRRFVTMEDFENAKDKVMMGAERRSMVMTEDEKMLTAYHEAGHAIVGLNVPQHDPIHKATIIPRGRALGLVMSLPERDQLSVSKTKYTSKIAMAMGGKVAEELKFGPENVTSGATSDIQQVSKIARAMVTQFGFSEELGHVDYANEQQSHLGPYGGGTSHSQETQKIIDQKVKELVDEGYQTAKRILTEKKEEWERLAQGLLEYETLTGSEIAKVVAGQPLNRGDDEEDDTPSSGTTSVAAIPKTRKPKTPKSDGGMEPEPSS
ncbi:membrane protease FtsH catalytic subunit [Litoreibacter ascidiaceicola]|uniref:ATP-dependent zinc metalloprotease FtsH n=1 Tax=Litoreibacter ascidiaceicola TaxID=1486859 RepID=A0A1M4Y763_9RHOB|nr:ATP-dependent zinc metalloprotease FtsH [Litoreibacter ascidiaceicola]SHF01548.1 membrane protease FtsH catalytic subunit [Litoreibacter ascidiaceicola]